MLSLTALACSASPTAPRAECAPPETPAVTPTPLPGGIVSGDWTVTRWEPPPGCRALAAGLFLYVPPDPLFPWWVQALVVLVAIGLVWRGVRRHRSSRRRPDRED